MFKILLNFKLIYIFLTLVIEKIILKTQNKEKFILNILSQLQKSIP